MQGSAKGGVLADPSPAAMASLLGWAAAVAQGAQRPSLSATSLLLKVISELQYVRQWLHQALKT